MSYTKKPDGIYKDKLGKLVEHKKYSTVFTGLRRCYLT